MGLTFEASKNACVNSYGMLCFFYIGHNGCCCPKRGIKFGKANRTGILMVLVEPAYMALKTFLSVTWMVMAQAR